MPSACIRASRRTPAGQIGSSSESTNGASVKGRHAATTSSPPPITTLGTWRASAAAAPSSRSAVATSARPSNSAARSMRRAGTPSIARAVAMPKPRRSSPTRRSITAVHHATVGTIRPPVAAAAMSAGQERVGYVARQRPPADAHPAPQARRVSDDEGVCGHVRDHDGSHTHHGVGADDHARPDTRARTQRGSFRHAAADGVRRGPGGGETLDAVVERSRVPFVGEDDASGDHDPVFDGDAGRDVDHRVDLDEVPDLDAVGDVRFLADDAVVADARRPAYVYGVPHLSPLSDPDAVFDEGRRVNARHLAVGSVAHACALSRPGVSHTPMVLTGIQRPERSDRYDASTAATVRRHSPGVIQGRRVPETTRRNAYIMATCDACRSYRPTCSGRGSCPFRRRHDVCQPTSRLPSVPWIIRYVARRVGRLQLKSIRPIRPFATSTITVAESSTARGWAGFSRVAWTRVTRPNRNPTMSNA